METWWEFHPRTVVIIIICSENSSSKIRCTIWKNCCDIQICVLTKLITADPTEEELSNLVQSCVRSTGFIPAFNFPNSSGIVERYTGPNDRHYSGSIQVRTIGTIRGRTIDARSRSQWFVVTNWLAVGKRDSTRWNSTEPILPSYSLLLYSNFYMIVVINN